MADGLASGSDPEAPGISIRGKDAGLPGPGGHEVRRAQAGETRALSQALARAFFEDPLGTYVVPDPTRRLAIVEQGFDLFLRRVWISHEETYTVGDPGVGACIWEPPGTWKIGAAKQLSMLPAMVGAFGRSLPRLLSALSAAERGHPEEPHYYLPILGVEPESQGRGRGSAMMFPILSRCDAEGVPAYLEASTPRNRALYERHGFKVTETFQLGRGGPTFWRMWRAPGPGPAA
ncbi:MAG TPA: GNAT family N-acetyltransferase [Solirubrobacterales bacterium]|nr:GNAT family N-acetyltransferase [Solirubrobacterales bacterium]